MVWAALSIGGLLVETSVIVVLGRQVTGRFEETADPERRGALVRRR